MHMLVLGQSIGVALLLLFSVWVLCKIGKEMNHHDDDDFDDWNFR